MYDNLQPGVYIQAGKSITPVKQTDWAGLLGGRERPAVDTLAAKVAWVFIALNKRRTRITEIPFEWMQGDSDISDTFGLMDYYDIMPRIDTALQVGGIAYLHKVRNGRGQVTAIRWLDPTSMEPDETTATADGYEMYWRSLPNPYGTGATRIRMPADDLIVFMLPSQREIDPDTSAGEATTLAAQVLYGMGRTSDAIYDNNALPVMLVTVPMGTSENDRKRLEGFFRRLFNYRGSNKDMRTVATREGVTVTPLSVDPDKVLNSDFERSKILTILAAHDVPESEVYEASNLATRRADQESFVGALGGRLAYIARKLNRDPDLMKLRLMLVIKVEQHPAMKRVEAENSVAGLRYVQMGMTPQAAAYLIGINDDDFPEEIQAAGIWATSQPLAELPPPPADTMPEDEGDEGLEDEGDSFEGKSIGWQIEAGQIVKWSGKRKNASPDDFEAKFLTDEDKRRLMGLPVIDHEAEQRQRFNDTLAAVEAALLFNGEENHD